MDEAQLIDRVLAGDPAAERALYDRHVDRVHRLAYRMAGDADLAQDITQDAFIRAYDRLAGFRGESSLATWLNAITMSVALNALRKVKRFRQREVDIELGETVGAPSRRSEPDLKERMTRAIDELPEGYRTVFVMHDVEGYTHEEIAGTLGVQVGTSKAQLFRARGRLRESLADFAGEWVS